MMTSWKQRIGFWGHLVSKATPRADASSARTSMPSHVHRSCRVAVDEHRHRAVRDQRRHHVDRWRGKDHGSRAARERSLPERIGPASDAMRAETALCASRNSAGVPGEERTQTRGGQRRTSSMGFICQTDALRETELCKPTAVRSRHIAAHTVRSPEVASLRGGTSGPVALLLLCVRSSSVRPAV